MMVSAALWDSTQGCVCIWPPHSSRRARTQPPPRPACVIKTGPEQPTDQSRAKPMKLETRAAAPSLHFKNLSQVCHPVILIPVVTLLAPSQFSVSNWCHGIRPLSDLWCSWQTSHQRGRFIIKLHHILHTRTYHGTWNALWSRSKQKYIVFLSVPSTTLWWKSPVVLL